MAILDYRNTPTRGMDSSPVQRLINWCTKTLLSTSRSMLQPRVTYPEKDQQNLAKRQGQQVRYFNQATRSLRELAEGEVVRMKPFRLGDKVWEKATVTPQLRRKVIQCRDARRKCLLQNQMSSLFLGKHQKEQGVRPVITVKVWRKE